MGRHCWPGRSRGRPAFWQGNLGEISAALASLGSTSYPPPGGLACDAVGQSKCSTGPPDAQGVFGQATTCGKGGDFGGDRSVGSFSSSREDLGKAPQQKRIVFIDSHPIDQAVRQKEERNAREEALAEAVLTPAEIKAARKRKTFWQEEHHDDCGSDLGPLEEKQLFKALAVEGSLGAAIAYSFLDADAFASDSADSSEDELERVVDNYSLHYLVGHDGIDHHVDPPSSHDVELEGLMAYLTQSHLQGSLDVVEMFGGE